MALRLLLISGFLLGAAATVLVFVFSDQVRWLRFAVLLALWAALVAAFAVARSRREAQTIAARENEITRTYQLELHREVAARREYEAGVAANVRDEAEDRNTEELKALRAQLDRLTATLTTLLDGDVLVERLTLSAEATRVLGRGDAARGRLAELLPELMRSGTADRERVQAHLPAVDDGTMDEGTVDDDAVDAEIVEDHLVTAPATEPEPAAEPEPAPRPSAPSTSWTRRHRRDLQQALATRTAAVEEAAAVEEVGDHEALDSESRISVSDLLAQFGTTAGPSRRRRRAD